MSKPNGFGLKIDDVRKKTVVAQADVQAKHNKACKEAFDFITKNAENEVEKAYADGRNKAYLYRWKYEEDSSLKTYCFNSIRISDILTKGSLLQDLNDYFNPDNDDNGYTVKWHKFKNTNPTQYGLYVSWFVSEKDESRESNESKK